MSESAATTRMAASAVPATRGAASAARSSSMKVAFCFSMTPLARQQLPGDAPRAAVARADENALALEIAQGRDRQVAAGEDPDRLVEQPAHRAQLRVLRMPPLLLLAGQASLQAADEAALHEARGDPRVVIGQLPQGEATLQGPQRGAPLLVLEPRRPPHLDLNAVLAQVFLVPGGQLVILGIARRDGDLALVVELLRVMQDR